MNVVIRPYRPEDHAERHALADLCERTADAAFGGGGLYYTPDPNSELLCVNLVATADGRMVGFVDGDQVMMPDETGKVAVVEPPEGYIHCIGVHPGYRRQEIGGRLLRAALREYERAGCVRVELCTPSTSAEKFFAAGGGEELRCLNNEGEGVGGNFEWRIPLLTYPLIIIK